MPINLDGSSTRSFISGVVPDLEMEWTLRSCAQSKVVGWKSFNEGFGLPISRKPCCPNLDGHALRLLRASSAAQMHKKVSEPPSPTVVSQAETKEPYFVATPHRSSREYCVEGAQDIFLFAANHTLVHVGI